MLPSVPSRARDPDVIVVDLILRRAKVLPRPSSWHDKDFDVFDGDRMIGRIYLVDRLLNHERWFWAVSFQVTGRKCYGNTTSLDEAKAALRLEYENWKAGR
jgi:hypothetical protein